MTLFITDIDGCLTTPFEAPDWKLITQLRELNRRSREEDEGILALSICSGRPLPYVEAVAQWMDIQHPVIFESAGVYRFNTNEIVFPASFDHEASKEVEALKRWMEIEIVPEYPGAMIEFSKRMDAGIVHPQKKVIDTIYPMIKEHVNGNHPRFEVHYTDVSVNTILKENNKKTGIRLLCEEIGIDPSQVAYIGDSSGDIPGFEIVGRAFSPSNASEAVKEVTEVLPYQSTRAVLEAYRLLIDNN